MTISTSIQNAGRNIQHILHNFNLAQVYPFPFLMPKAEKSYTGEGIAHIEKLQKPDWRPKER